MEGERNLGVEVVAVGVEIGNWEEEGDDDGLRCSVNGGKRE